VRGRRRLRHARFANEQVQFATACLAVAALDDNRSLDKAGGRKQANGVCFDGRLEARRLRLVAQYGNEC